MIVLKGEYTEMKEIIEDTKIYKKYSDDDLELSMFNLREQRSYFLAPPEATGAVKIYRIIQGQVRLHVSDKLLTVHDSIILKPGDENLGLDTIERTNLLVTSFGDNAFDTTSSKMDAIQSTMMAIQEKDEYTNEHCIRVARLAKHVAKHLCLSNEQTYRIMTAAKYHDLGKITIHDDILNKPGKLTYEEYESMKTHVCETAKLLPEHIPPEIVKITQEHHERLDGSGYPNGVMADEITYEGQILAVIDTYDAMTTDRVYKKGKTDAEAIKELYSMTLLYNLEAIKALDAVINKNLSE